jgi:L-lactate utilization protein LutB
MGMVPPVHGWWLEKLAENCLRRLKTHGFDVLLAVGREDARHAVLARVGHLESFGFGGSETVRQVGLPQALEARGKILFDHWQADLPDAQEQAIRLQQGRCECFICSANAIAATGEIVNVDGIGNRNCAMTFGPGQVVIIAGVNKVTSDLPTALRRVQEVAAPMRARSLGLDTPCAHTGQCVDCNSPQRICRITTILHRRPMRTPILVVLVREALGY